MGFHSSMEEIPIFTDFMVRPMKPVLKYLLVSSILKLPTRIKRYITAQEETI